MTKLATELAREIPDGEGELQREIKHDYSSSHDGIVPLEARRGDGVSERAKRRGTESGAGTESFNAGYKYTTATRRVPI